MDSRLKKIASEQYEDIDTAIDIAEMINDELVYLNENISSLPNNVKQPIYDMFPDSLQGDRLFSFSESLDQIISELQDFKSNNLVNELIDESTMNDFERQEKINKIKEEIDEALDRGDIELFTDLTDEYNKLLNYQALLNSRLKKTAIEQSTKDKLVFIKDNFINIASDLTTLLDIVMKYPTLVQLINSKLPSFLKLETIATVISQLKKISELL
jgi:hypothetical protein